jgi:hypothetical protein
MIRTKLFLAGALALMVTFMGAAAYTQEPTNQITYFTFSAPFELPGGQVLPAGKYVFQIVDSPSNRHIIQIMSEDRQKMHATLLAIPAQRQDPAPEPEVRFMETAANTPPAIRTWWYPGRSIGHEFIYPKEHARRLAAAQRDSVLTVSSDSASVEDMQKADLARINAAGQESPWSADTTVAENTTMPQQSGAETAAARAQATPPAAAQTTTTSRTNSSLQSTPAESTSPTASASQNAMPDRTARAQTDDSTRTRLPQTASPLPLFGLLGLGSLLGAGALRCRR